MAGLVFACVVPHGFPIIPDLSDDAEGALATRAAMEEVGRRCAAARPDVLVVATPHGTRVDNTICLASVARGAGTLRWEGRQVEMNVPVDGPMTDLIAERAAARGIPIARASFAGNRRDQSVIPLDWGTITPLWFLGHGRNLVGHGDVLAPEPEEDAGPPVVIAAPSRLLPRETMVEFGTAVAEAAAQSGRRVAFVASCDWAHTHKESGPYGYHPAAAKVDAAVVAALRDNDPGRLITLPEDEVQHAAIDGLWQTLMLAGAMAHTPMRGELLSYEAPSYYSMIVATFEPVG
ncbi:aromatic ring-opening dioxygenase subunit LigB [Sphaerobacter thermophilus]|uniref:Extradiol ring-cleavage dioxygenase class III protein subunit B n=2 Tax=Sphaerobacter TaxID=2056 RepID=D1C6V3_SPHTD|nr:aromatic ring-opening dioxygenase subunit LigB [Sphaerobacter thermophilus]ACZ37714.1 Extradiol ring-cleavage dioxygenase class III protein subunit B [Sphaerobacter thermophilus DSM 20745]